MIQIMFYIHGSINIMISKKISFVIYIPKRNPIFKKYRKNILLIIRNKKEYEKKKFEIKILNFVKSYDRKQKKIRFRNRVALRWSSGLNMQI